MPVSAIGPDTLLSRKPELVAADMASEAVLLDIDSGNFYQLNATGARIWALVDEPRSLSSLCEALAGDFAVDAATCEADVTGFVANLVDIGLLKAA